jgi:hypothetical protein
VHARRKATTSSSSSRVSSAPIARHIVCTRSTTARTGSSIGEAVSIRLRPVSRSVPAISAWRPAAVSSGLSFTLRPGKQVSAATGSDQDGAGAWANMPLERVDDRFSVQYVFEDVQRRLDQQTLDGPRLICRTCPDRPEGRRIDPVARLVGITPADRMWLDFDDVAPWRWQRSVTGRLSAAPSFRIWDWLAGLLRRLRERCELPARWHPRRPPNHRLWQLDSLRNWFGVA